MQDCIACNGGAIPCKGGGNLHCWRRDPRPSVCAGILDTYGCIRVVVAAKESLGCHVRCDEIGIVVADLTVHQPIAWQDIPSLIGRVEHTVKLWCQRLPNDPITAQCAKMYSLRQLEQPRGSLDLSSIVET
jgi:hypothetical protein